MSENSEKYLAELPEPQSRVEAYLKALVEKGGIGGGGSESDVEISLQDKTFTENGTYNADAGYDGFGTVTVDVESSGITENYIEMVPFTAMSFKSYSSIAKYMKVVNLQSVTTIGISAFSNCSSLESISCPLCTMIDRQAFCFCTSLKSVSFPMCTTIEYQAFLRCTSLVSVNFPSCTSIGSSAFYSCSSLMSVFFPVCEFINANAFASCSSLESISFPACTNIDGNAFLDCRTLKSISFPICTSIGYGAFSGCSSLSSIDFPECISLSDRAFQRCVSLTEVLLGASSICTLAASTAFVFTPIASGTGYIYVPASLVDAYKSATNWTYFSNQIRSIEELPTI